MEVPMSPVPMIVMRALPFAIFLSVLSNRPRKPPGFAPTSPADCGLATPSVRAQEIVHQRRNRRGTPPLSPPPRGRGELRSTAVLRSSPLPRGGGVGGEGRLPLPAPGRGRGGEVLKSY